MDRVLVVAMIAEAAAQSVPASVMDQNQATRIATLSAGLHFSGRDVTESTQKLAQLDDVTQQVWTEIDNYLGARFDAREGSEKIEGRLRTILADHQPNPEYGDLAFARTKTLRYGESLVVAYTLVRGPHHDLGTIRGYHWDGRQFELVDKAGDDLEGYSMFKAELTSPIRDELWLLAWGQAHTFNGTKVRFRVYKFDGQMFRSVWTPDDVFNPQLRITASGFAIDHMIRNPPWDVHDEYTLTQDGPVKTN